MKDYIIQGMAYHNEVRFYGAYTKNLVSEAQKIHDTYPVVTAALGRLMTGALMMGAMLKNDTDLLTLYVKGDGPLRGVLATADAAGNVKGFPYEKHIDLPLNQQMKLDVAQAIGKGTLSVTKDIGLKEPYVGQVPLVSGEIGEDLTYYFAKSEQTPSVVALGVLVDTDGSVLEAGGFIIQMMPDASENTLTALEENLSSFSSVTNCLSAGETLEQMMQTLFINDDTFTVLDKKPANYRCDCSRERVEKALISIGLEELSKILEQDQGTSLNCHFCNQSYRFDKQDLEMMIQNLKK